METETLDSECDEGQSWGAATTYRLRMARRRTCATVPSSVRILGGLRVIVTSRSVMVASFPAPQHQVGLVTGLITLDCDVASWALSSPTRTPLPGTQLMNSERHRPGGRVGGRIWTCLCLWLIGETSITTSALPGCWHARPQTSLRALADNQQQLTRRVTDEINGRNGAGQQGEVTMA